MIYYDDIDVSLNGSGIMAESAEISVTPSLSPVYSLGRRGIWNNVASAPPTANININYFLETFFDHNKNTIDFIKTGDTSQFHPCDRIVIGNITGSGYLASFSFAAQPNSPIIVSTSYNCYSEMVGDLRAKNNTVKYNVTNSSGLAHGYGLHITSSGNSQIVPTYDFNYNFSIDWSPIYKIGNKVPIQVNYVGATERFTLTRDVYTGVNIMSGVNVTGYLNTTGDSNIDLISLNSVANTRNLSTMNFNLSGAKVISNSVSAALDDFVRVQTAAINYY